MKSNLKLVLQLFIYCSLVGGICAGIALSIYSGELLRGFASGLLGGVLISAVLSSYLSFGLLLFQKKWLFYSNMPNQLQIHNAKTIYRESIAGNATGLRIKYGGLFLTDDFILFITHKFAIKPLVIEIPLKRIKVVKKAKINLFKAYSGGLGRRLLIEMINEEHYEFVVLDIDGWTRTIKSGQPPT